MEVRAVGKYIRGSSQKARLVIDLIRGKPVGNARATLMHLNKRAAHPIRKVLDSAIANAKDRSPQLDVDDLVVSKAYVDGGPTKGRRRVRPAPMGRAYREIRRSSHITICVSDQAAEPNKEV
ncbi:MAG: 50S ribosomal protein L22 [Acidobacteria bacterium]|nr:50S ribosomal protein L22 [Acidobacteriota bacterium]MBI3657622.1 50S ribosomal protein L22 [Acidobacteriota bacterium]